MSHSTMKTLSSIRSLTDEWSIRKEGGKQSFFVLKEIDKLLADTPIDDVVSSKDVADKKKEVTMLRLERDEMLIRQQLAKRQSELDDTSPIEQSVIGNLRSINTRQHTQICEYCETIGALRSTIGELEERDTLKTTAIDELQKTIEEMKSKVEPPNLAVMVLLHNLNAKTEALEADLSNSKSAIMMKNGVINDRNETISDLRMAASDMLDTINKCSRREAEDSKVLMQVVETVRQLTDDMGDHTNSQLMKVYGIVEDYLAAPESPVVTLKTPSIGTRVVSKNEETHVIDEAKMRAVHALIGCGDKWVLHLGVDAVEVAKYNQTIDELTETTRKLEGRLSSMYAANSDQDTTINKLNALLADEKMTLAAYRSNPLSDQVTDRDKRIEQLMVLNEALRIDMELAHNLSRDHIANQAGIIEGLRSRMTGARIIIDNQATSIEELTKDLDARNTVIKDFKAIEQKETDRLHKIIEGNGKIIDELNDMCSDACGKLEKIEKIAEHPAYDCFSTALDEIIKIIQEE